jgi:hypothetical protein
MMNLKIVQLKSPYETLSQTKARDYFSRHLHHRIESYKSRYGGDTFPLGAEDFVSDHILIVDQDEQEEKILGSFKIIDSKTCQRFNLVYPLLHTLTDQENCPELKNQVCAYLSNDEKVSYIGGMTISPEVIQDSLKRRTVRHLISTAQVYSVIERGYPRLLVTGSIENKSYHYLEWMGLYKFSDQSVRVRDLGEVQAYVMKLDRWSDSVLKMAKKFQSIWDEREIIEDMKISENKMVG